MKMNLVEQYIKRGSKYPELDKIAQKIANDTGKNINKSVQNVKEYRQEILVGLPRG